MQVHNYRGLTFVVPKLEAQGICFEPVNTTNSRNLDEFSIWDLDRFSKEKTVKTIGRVSNELNFSTPKDIRILDLPIKMPGSNVYRIPIECALFLDVIKQIAEAEHSMNPVVEEYHAYLTIDQGWVNPGATQRNSGCHVDGFQGARILNKTRINRSYVVSDKIPTVFYPHKFNLSLLSDDKHDFFAEMNIQADEKKSYRVNPYEIALMDAYTVHRADTAKVLSYRTFMRLSYDVKVFDRLGNTHNPLFRYDWNMVPRDVHANLNQYR